MRKAPDGRYIFIWRGDAGALADAIAEATDLVDQDGGPAQLNENGELVGANLATFRAIISANICGERVIPNGTGWKREHYSYEFAPAPRPKPPTQQSGIPQKALMTEPDHTTLIQIYTKELQGRLPKVMT